MKCFEILPLFVIQAIFVDAEPIYFGHIHLGRFYGHLLWVREEKEVRKGSTKVGSVQIGALGGLGVVDFVAAGAKDVHGVVARHVGETYW